MCAITSYICNAEVVVCCFVSVLLGVDALPGPMCGGKPKNSHESLHRNSCVRASFGIRLLDIPSHGRVNVKRM